MKRICNLTEEEVCAVSFELVTEFLPSVRLKSVKNLVHGHRI